MLTITGGLHLAEFTTFWMRPITHFDSTKPGRRCLRGKRSLVPPMNVPTRYVLPPTARAISVYGKSSHGPADDVHAVLVPEPGASAVVPLTVATPTKREEVARLAQLLEAASWQVAWTMPENPHSYSRRETWAIKEDFDFACYAIRRLGHREGYVPPGAVKVAYRETVFAYGSHFVWSGWGPVVPSSWINRKVLPAPVVATVEDQTLLVEDARVLDIPPLPVDFGGLDPSVTQNKFFQTGVAVFGWPPPVTKTRRRRRA